tara:strand:+ start:241 stop:462 length:222 start_codon:yes stop_codon:yes gene_type:complete
LEFVILRLTNRLVNRTLIIEQMRNITSVTGTHRQAKLVRLFRQHAPVEIFRPTCRNILLLFRLVSLLMSMRWN